MNKVGLVAFILVGAMLMVFFSGPLEDVIFGARSSGIVPDAIKGAIGGAIAGGIYSLIFDRRRRN